MDAEVGRPCTWESFGLFDLGKRKLNKNRLFDELGKLILEKTKKDIGGGTNLARPGPAERAGTSNPRASCAVRAPPSKGPNR